MSAPKKFGEPTDYVGARLPRSLVTAIDQESVNLMEEFSDGSTFTRSDVIRLGLTDFLSRKNDARKKLRTRVRRARAS